MNAGRELDALVAEKVMGLVVCKRWSVIHHGGLSGPAYWIAPSVAVNGKCPDHTDGNCVAETWPYSTNIASAWQVVEKLRESPEQWAVNICDVGPWRVELIGRKDIFASADTAPLAICLAALKAVGVEVEKSKNAT